MYQKIIKNIWGGTAEVVEGRLSAVNGRVKIWASRSMRGEKLGDLAEGGGEVVLGMTRRSRPSIRRGLREGELKAGGGVKKLAN